MTRISIGGAFEASNIAFGCMRLGGLDEKKAFEVLDTALECSIDFFDHADIYHDGYSEELFGKYLKSKPSVRDNIKIQTKCGIRKGFFDFSKKHIIESAEKSLKRLGTDHVDFLLLHRPDTLMEPEEVAEAFDTLQKEGKVLNFGVSNHNPMQIELLKTCVKQKIAVNQLQLSILESGMITSGLNANMKNPESFMHDGSVLEYSRLSGMTIQAWSPFLALTNGKKTPFLDDAKNYPVLIKKLDEMAEKYNTNKTAVATAWLLRHPAKIQVIVGSMTPQRIKDTCLGSEITLSREDWYDIYRAAGFCLP